MAFFENPHVPSGLSYDCNRHAKFYPFFSKSILPLLTYCIWELITFSSVSKTFLSLIRLFIHLPRTFSSFLEPVSQFQQSILEWRAFKFCSNDSHTTFSREDYNDFQSTCLFHHNIVQARNVFRKVMWPIIGLLVLRHAHCFHAVELQFCNYF